MAGFFERLKSGLSHTAEAVANLLARPMDAEEHDYMRLGKGGRGDGFTTERADDTLSRGFGGGGFAEGSF